VRRRYTPLHFTCCQGTHKSDTILKTASRGMRFERGALIAIADQG
jgi:hypothetical protein